MAGKTQKPFRVALLSMPWAIFNRPSIQLGSLKAYLEKDIRIQVDTIHPYLEVAKTLSTDTYRLIAGDSWAGEALYAPLLFPEKQPQAKQLFDKRMIEYGKKRFDYNTLQKKLQDGLDTTIAQIDDCYDLVGFTICFNQLFSSLIAAKALKRKNRNCPIVIGGSSCVGEIGRSILRHFSQIDYVIDGEGETALHTLCLALAGHSNKWSKQIMGHRGQKECHINSDSKIVDLNLLPSPDYTDYFQQMNKLHSHQPFIPTLVVEFSRGCWWNKCSFCNLNLQWCNYRSKRSEICAKQVEALAEKHKSLTFTFTDNSLPIKEADLFFQAMAEKKKDYRFFAEIRTITDPKRIQLYAHGGLTTAQVGIEALSSRLLTQLNKGTSTIENIGVMRHCLESHIRLEGNLIIEFPGSKKEDIEETMAALDFVLPYTPLLSASFFLGHGSPVYSDPKKYNITAITQHPNNRKLFPQKLLGEMKMLTCDYRGDRLRQRRLWKPVVAKIKLWHTFHLKRRRADIPALGYRDGGSFLIIRQERSAGHPLQHRLTGMSRDIYLYCTTIRSLTEIGKTFPHIKTTTLTTFLDDLVQKHLVFCEQNKYLSLAVRMP